MLDSVIEMLVAVMLVGRLIAVDLFVRNPGGPHSNHTDAVQYSGVAVPVKVTLVRPILVAARVVTLRTPKGALELVIEPRPRDPSRLLVVESKIWLPVLSSNR